MGLLNAEDLNIEKVEEIKKATKKFEKHIQKTYPGYDKIKSEMSNLALSTSNINCAMKYFKDPRYERIQYKHTIFDQYILAIYWGFRRNL